MFLIKFNIRAASWVAAIVVPLGTCGMETALFADITTNR